MQQYDDPGAAVEPPPSSAARPPGDRSRRRPAAVWLVVTVAVALGLGVALVVGRVLLPGQGTGPGPGPAGGPRAGTTAAGGEPGPSASGSTPPGAAVAARDRAVTDLLVTRAAAVTAADRTAFLGTVAPGATEFLATQAELFDRVTSLGLAQWSYLVTGEGPGLAPERAAALPPGSAIVRVRLTYRLAGTDTTTDREQYLTVVPSGGGWLLASDTDASASGFDTQRDLWDLGPVRAVRGDHSLVVADRRGTSARQARRVADEADLAVGDVDEVWTGDWSRHPVLVMPRSQQDMATLIGSDGDGLAQIAAVTTGTFESGLSRGDRIVLNPGAWGTLGAVGRRVVLTHEMTHVATRSSSVLAPPIWLSEGFADYVAYRATPVPLSIVAADILDEVRDDGPPRHLPQDDDFDASRGDIAAAYEGAWLACRMIAEEYGQKRLLRLYMALSDSSGPGWPEETAEVLGVDERRLERDWRAYLRAKAAA